MLTLPSKKRVETNAPTKRKMMQRKIPKDLAGDFINGSQIVGEKRRSSTGSCQKYL